MSKPSEETVHRYRRAHRTVSIPDGAHDELSALRDMIIESGGVQALPASLRDFAASQMQGGEAFTRGLVFWLACKYLRDQITLGGEL